MLVTGGMQRGLPCLSGDSLAHLPKWQLKSLGSGTTYSIRGCCSCRHQLFRRGKAKRPTVATTHFLRCPGPKPWLPWTLEAFHRPPLAGRGTKSSSDRIHIYLFECCASVNADLALWNGLLGFCAGLQFLCFREDHFKQNQEGRKSREVLVSPLLFPSSASMRPLEQHSILQEKLGSPALAFGPIKPN